MRVLRGRGGAKGEGEGVRLLDLFCGAGGASKGYDDAGFDEIVGVDNQPQKRYPYQFVLGDALEYVTAHGHEFDLIHASPPCQVHSVLKHFAKKTHLDLVADTRIALHKTRKPYVIENVPGAPLENPLMLCGTMFGLGVIRHRLFESKPPIWFAPAMCNHHSKTQRSYTRGDKYKTTGSRKSYTYGKDIFLLSIYTDSFRIADGQHAMQIDWMTRKELSQAIPPAYTEFIGKHMIKFIEANA